MFQFYRHQQIQRNVVNGEGVGFGILRQERCNNRCGKILLDSNKATPNYISADKRQYAKFEWKIIDHPPYDPDLVSNEYYLFSWKHTWKKLNPQAMQNWRHLSIPFCVGRWESGTTPVWKSFRSDSKNAFFVTWTTLQNRWMSRLYLCFAVKWCSLCEKTLKTLIYFLLLYQSGPFAKFFFISCVLPKPTLLSQIIYYWHTFFEFIDFALPLLHSLGV